MSQYHGGRRFGNRVSATRIFLRCIPFPCVQELVAMLSRPAKFSIAIGLCLFFSSKLVSAQQEGVPPMPDPTYGGGSYTSFQSPTDLPMPQADDLSNPNTVTIPIPGGGDITVDGPNAPDEKGLPNLPGSQWGTTQQNPFSHGNGPMGPPITGSVGP
jgi:hypothetical protein